ncbi:MAG TPA: hypothetical protein VMV46_18605 [Thermoanaerobaculia bacterium]|nr:hypothetical protein [Thermoanaerobaculia bacterium]
MEYQARLDVLERRIRDLQLDYERFLAGDLAKTPVDTEAELATAVRDLRLGARTAADGFRLSTLEARFNTYRELFNRRVRDREIGLRPRRPAEIEARPDPRDGFTVARRVDADWAAALFQGLYGDTRSPAVDLDTFQHYLERQVDTLRQRTGCTSVRLRLVERDGKMTLRAKPVDPRQPTTANRRPTPEA